jgi:hypothetical protein
MALFGEPGHRPLDEILPPDDSSSSSEDQRERPRFGPIEEIANVAYQTLRKHKDVLPEPPTRSEESDKG